MNSKTRNPGQIHHLEFYVSDLERSLKFWGWLLEELGYEKYQNWDLGQSWKLGNSYIGFVQTEENYQQPGHHRKRSGLNHIAFYLSEEALDSFRTKLNNRGIPLLYEDQALSDALFFEDPDRIKIELAAY